LRRETKKNTEQQQKAPLIQDVVAEYPAEDRNEHERLSGAISTFSEYRQRYPKKTYDPK
jgi:hypothetical protein